MAYSDDISTLMQPANTAEILFRLTVEHVLSSKSQGSTFLNQIRAPSEARITSEHHLVPQNTDRWKPTMDIK